MTKTPVNLGKRFKSMARKKMYKKNQKKKPLQLSTNQSPDQNNLETEKNLLWNCLTHCSTTQAGLHSIHQVFLYCNFRSFSAAYHTVVKTVALDLTRNTWDGQHVSHCHRWEKSGRVVLFPALHKDFQCNWQLTLSQTLSSMRKLIQMLCKRVTHYMQLTTTRYATLLILHTFLRFVAHLRYLIF